MSVQTYIPDHYSQTYELETEKKTFQQFKKTSQDKELLPDLIRLEVNNGYNQITGANTLLKIRDNSNWKNCSITGLRPTKIKGYYYGDFKIKGKRSLAVIYVDSKKVIIRLCPKFYPHKKPQLLKIVIYIIQNFKTH